MANDTNDTFFETIFIILLFFAKIYIERKKCTFGLFRPY
jgi:hypothetical protein